MSNPSELLHRAKKNGKKGCVVKTQSSQMFAREIAPAPQPMQTQDRPLQPAPARQMPGGHANYSALMRSHDRVATRHIPKS